MTWFLIYGVTFFAISLLCHYDLMLFDLLSTRVICAWMGGAFADLRGFNVRYRVSIIGVIVF